jgi:HK97 family phage major capsid protein/HK97 family phage prohead protease
MDKQLSYSLITVKAIDEDKRVIRGMASTPEADRVGDVVDPMGASFGKNLPLLWMHRHDLPVGTVNFGKPTPKGIPFEASLPVVSEPSQLKARIDEAWQSVKAGLIRAVSIGFRPIEYNVIKETGGLRFTKTEIYELSLVSVPANANATITEIKAMDKQLASSGNSAVIALNTKSCVKETIVKINNKKDKTMFEKLKSFRDELEAKNAKLVEMAEKSIKEGLTFDSAQQEEYDAIEAEVKALKDHISRLESAEKAAKATAKPVVEKAGQSDEGAVAARSGVVITAKSDKTNEGIGFARMARVKALAYMGDLGTRDEAQIAKMLYPNDDNLIKGFVEKTAVPAANTLSATWAGNLINEGGAAFADFVEYLRPRTLYGQISPRFRRLPFDAPVMVQGTGANASWVKEGMAKPVTSWTYTRTKMSPLKVATIAAATKESLMRSSVSLDSLIRDELARSIGAAIDTTMISADAAVADESPAGLLNGVSATVLTGGSVAGIRCDISAMLQAMVSNNLTIAGAFWVMPETVAIALSLATNEVGAPAFPGITPTGGTLAGLPVFTSQYVPVETAGPVVALIKGDEIFLGDEGGVQVKISDQASIQLLDNPTQNSIGSTAATTSVSMFQTNSVAFLVERFLNFQKRRTAAIVWANVDWDTCLVS